MSEVRLLMRLAFGRVVLWGELLGYLLLRGGALRVLDQMLGPCTSQSSGLRSLYTHSFSIIGGLLFLL